MQYIGDSRGKTNLEFIVSVKALYQYTRKPPMPVPSTPLDFSHFSLRIKHDIKSSVPPPIPISNKHDTKLLGSNKIIFSLNISTHASPDFGCFESFGVTIRRVKHDQIIIVAIAWPAFSSEHFDVDFNPLFRLHMPSALAARPVRSGIVF